MMTRHVNHLLEYLFWTALIDILYLKIITVTYIHYRNTALIVICKQQKQRLSKQSSKRSTGS